MRITSLVENISNTDLKAKHGLSLYFETKHAAGSIAIIKNQCMDEK